MFFDTNHSLGHLVPYFVKDQMIDKHSQMQIMHDLHAEKVSFDQRKNKFIRLGFGINHGFNEAKKLSEFLLKNIE